VGRDCPVLLLSNQVGVAITPLWQDWVSARSRMERARTSRTPAAASDSAPNVHNHAPLGRIRLTMVPQTAQGPSTAFRPFFNSMTAPANGCFVRHLTQYVS